MTPMAKIKMLWETVEDGLLFPPELWPEDYTPPGFGQLAAAPKSLLSPERVHVGVAPSKPNVPYAVIKTAGANQSVRTSSQTLYTHRITVYVRCQRHEDAVAIDSAVCQMLDQYSESSNVVDRIHLVMHTGDTRETDLAGAWAVESTYEVMTSLPRTKT